MKNYIIFFFCVIQSCNSASQNDSLCEKCNIASSNLVYEFEIEGDSTKLDSALYYVELGIANCPKYKGNLILRKLGILSFKRDYDTGIEFIPTLKNPFFDDLPYYNSVLLKRFYAMRSLSQGDTVTYKQYVYSILDAITPFMIEHQAALDSLCKNDDMSTILANSLSFLHWQYYFYRAIIEDPVVLAKEFDLLRQKGYNSQYIKMLETMYQGEEDFLIFSVY
jgi:hypothetical protein